MIKTKWKPKAEIEYSLKDMKTVSVFTCGGCARMYGTGGDAGIEYLMKLFKELGKEVIIAETIEPGCFEELIHKAYADNKKAITGSDALVVSGCPASIKTVYTCNPEVPVIGVLDPIGLTVATEVDTPVTRTQCMMCAQCVINFTAGICPVTGCPSKSKYGPCSKAFENDSKCAVNSDMICVWHEISKAADIEALEYLKSIHKSQSV